MKKLILLAMVFGMFMVGGCATLDNSCPGKHCPTYMREDVSPEVRKAMMQMDSFRGYDSPWPYCSDQNKVMGIAAERL